jgi:hypothetical protein
VGGVEEVGRHAAEMPVHQVGCLHFHLLTSTPPVGDETQFEMGYSQSRRIPKVYT